MKNLLPAYRMQGQIVAALTEVNQYTDEKSAQIHRYKFDGANIHHSPRPLRVTLLLYIGFIEDFVYEQ